MRLQFLSFLLFSVTCVAEKTLDSAEKCKPLEMAIFEEMKVLKSTSIKKLYEAYKLSAGCDDGFYGEGISDIVVQTLAKDYMGTLKLISRDQNLKELVIKHIDATASWDDLEKIVVNSKKQCPRQQKALCSLIKNLADKASKEAR